MITVKQFELLIIPITSLKALYWTQGKSLQDESPTWKTDALTGVDFPD